MKNWKKLPGEREAMVDRESCIRGHDLTDDENVYVRPEGYVECRVCIRLRQRRKYERRKERYGMGDMPIYVAEG